MGAAALPSGGTAHFEDDLAGEIVSLDEDEFSKH
jgi:hypothetical protein